MARTHKTALIKQQMADREAARTAGNNHIEAEEATASAEGNNDGGDASALEEKAPATSATVDTSEAMKSLVNEPVAVSVAFDDLLKTWPYLPIPGFGFDVAEADLFCVRGDTWLNDATMRAFCVFLDTYKNNTTVTIPPVKKQALKKPVKAEPILADQQLQQIHSGLTSRQYLLMPINLSGAHWVCLVIDGISKKIELYDSMGSTMYLKRLKAIADEIVAALPDAYEEITVNGPLQHDGDSCGVLVCLQLWKCVSAEAPSDVTKSGITKLRWKILQGILKVKRRL
ncbi:hypothetical protein F443_03869 [Phytophthora nicotianae P1569]|uniref:Ubiquitin-like protease family profile domain-containing protein n=2 Tax=Phytophthora nicotianae TaxID=4792 RepID=V9FNS3_PHYNI|nr:hypothetical protein F443_03869 [Phytophthora nicotianae P1569]